MAEGSSTSAPFRAAERVVLDENRILQALEEDVESDVENGAETDVGKIQIQSRVTKIRKMIDLCRMMKFL
ncbi:hypothetical protein J6590_091083 [Homalodisca vitripennis]|nr:hypothetical protein J6590_091083 [Homalodisca vitripennis]